MKFKSKGEEIEAASLRELGLTAEEIEGYFDFCRNVWKIDIKPRRTIAINGVKRKQ
jgi:hypothetical protein